ncbi:MAG: ABC transporter ATP-binding protein [Bacteroidetes bacterium]|nr:MAG: ABC transporter ATP-binding protein [Bacteroidota bacterium]
MFEILKCMKIKRDNIINITDLDVGYIFSKKKNKTIHADINLSSFKGELTALIGKNGIGKSTLLRTICNLQKSLNGNIEIFNKEISQYSQNDLAKRISFVSTEAINVGYMKVFDFVALGRFPYTNWIGKLTNKDVELVREALALVKMDAFAQKYLNEISDGERQRVMIARTLAQDTDIIILDEPTAFLDMPNKYEIVHLLNHLTKTKNKTIIFSSHDIDIAMSQCDKMWLMFDNSIIEGAPEDLILNNIFSEIFENTNLNFNINTGEFKTINHTNNHIGLIGEGIYFFWTKKALERMGFIVNRNKSVSNKIVIKTDNQNTKWMLEGKEIVFNSIYELSQNLYFSL